jgi:hypothetical protein
MKKYRYTGLFRSSEGHEYTLTLSCDSYLQAMILLTADAIRSGRHYQLSTISDEKGNVRQIDDILKISELIS